MKTRVWLNHWFSTAYYIIELLKEGEDFVIVGSNTDDNCVYRTVCDEWFTEPSFESSDEYIQFCLGFCKKQKIGVFIPRRNMLAVSKRIADFDAIGVRVLVERDYPLMSELSDKVKTYQMFEKAQIGKIPPYFVVNSVAEYENAYANLKTPENRVCIKFAVDEGAVSFRVIDDQMEFNLKTNVGAKISYENSINALRKLENFPDLLVLPYLSDTEVSVDCLSMPSGNHIIIPRYKSWTRSETIKYEDEIVNTCKLFLDKFPLSFPCNLQFKYENDTPFLLEINARMSGGIQFSCMAGGVNIPNIAVNRLLGIEKNAVVNQVERIVTYIEKPLLLQI
ncbi:MAG: ATP-grasp domain-containing protein [Clostridiales bacterium]|jgi:hypothetical protein|nr:ATP-grasp domain-containing protein [Clostridiales bacterium]